MEENNNNKKSKVTLVSVFQSVVAAAIGVQSEKNRQRDFSHGKPVYFIIAGLVFLLVFIVTIIAVVQLVLPGAPQG